MIRHLPSVALLAACAVLAPPTAFAFEAPPVLNVQEIAGDIPLTGADYALEQTVPTDGFMALVTINTPFGPFTASGPGMLDARLNEVRALSALEHLQQDDQFRQAAEQTAGDTFASLRRLAENPEDTIKGIPEGVGRFFNRTGRSIKTGFQKMEDLREGQLPGVEADSASALPGGPAAPLTGARPGFAETIARAGGDVAVNILGFDTQRRRLAKDLAIDPYTTNPVLSAKLDDVTWAAFAGGLGVNVVTSLIPGGMIVSVSSQLTDWVWDTSPGDLRVEVETTLRDIGIPGDQIDRFLRHHWYTLSMQAALAGSLAQLDGVAGRAGVMPLVLGVGSEGQARFVVQSLEMLAIHHRTRAALSGLEVAGTVIGRMADGASVVMAPVDYLSWSPLLAEFAEAAPGQTRMLKVTGQITDMALAELTALGWSVTDNSALRPVMYPVR